MTDKNQPPSSDDPSGGHDPAALKDAASRMHAEKSGDAKGTDDQFDPDGPHDPAALEDAEEKMAVKRPE